LSFARRENVYENEVNRHLTGWRPRLLSFALVFRPAGKCL